MQVKQDFVWERVFAAGQAEIRHVTIPAGAPVELRDGCYWVAPGHFRDGILHHDAACHGCRVAPDNVLGCSVAVCRHCSVSGRCRAEISEYECRRCGDTVYTADPGDRLCGCCRAAIR
jgi:hypothetical protein